MPTYTSKTCPNCQSIFQVLPRDSSQKYCSRNCSHVASRTLPKTLNRVSNCVTCNASLKRGQNQFCSRSCATSYHNKQRWDGHVSKIQLKRPQLKIPKPVYIRKCSVCSESLSDARKKYCIPCSPNISHYRTLCRFTFNVFDFPEEFDLQLLAKYGWFSPNGYKRRNTTVNLNGVSRDHLYTVSDGFQNNVDPTILAHPANCSLMVHNGPNGNNSKKKSSITIDELKARIDRWNQKYGGKWLESNCMPYRAAFTAR